MGGLGKLFWFVCSTTLTRSCACSCMPSCVPLVVGRISSSLTLLSPLFSSVESSISLSGVSAFSVVAPAASTCCLIRQFCSACCDQCSCHSCCVACTYYCHGPSACITHYLYFCPCCPYLDTYVCLPLVPSCCHYLCLHYCLFPLILFVGSGGSGSSLSGALPFLYYTFDALAHPRLCVLLYSDLLH